VLKGFEGLVTGQWCGGDSSPGNRMWLKQEKIKASLNIVVFDDFNSRNNVNKYKSYLH
jgi:hypothetical protein